MNMISVDAGIRRRFVLAREAAKLRQKVAAEEIGVTRQKLSRWENGDSSPTPEELRAMCIAYGVTPSYLLFGVAGLAPVVFRALRGESLSAKTPPSATPIAPPR